MIYIITEKFRHLSLTFWNCYNRIRKGGSKQNTSRNFDHSTRPTADYFQTAKCRREKIHSKQKVYIQMKTSVKGTFSRNISLYLKF